MKKVYYKLINNIMTHHSYQYHLGRNDDRIKFNTDYCAAGGLYVTDSLHYVTTFSANTTNREFHAQLRIAVPPYIEHEDEITLENLSYLFKHTDRYLAICTIPEDADSISFKVEQASHLHIKDESYDFTPISRKDLITAIDEERHNRMYADKMPIGLLYNRNLNGYYIRGFSASGKCHSQWIFDEYVATQYPPANKTKCSSIIIEKLIDLWDPENSGVGKRYHSLACRISTLNYMTFIADMVKRHYEGKRDVLNFDGNAIIERWLTEHPQSIESIAKISDDILKYEISCIG